jgi:retinol dehydrogenase-12
MQFESDGTPKILTKFMANYMQSKIGVAWLAILFAERLGGKGVLSNSVHPGLMPTGLQKHQPWFVNSIVRPALVSSQCMHSCHPAPARSPARSPGLCCT